MKKLGILVLLAGAAFFALPRPVAAKSAAASTFTVDPVHSAVLFRIQHMGVGYFHGRFNDIAGSFTLDEGAGAVEITVRGDSVDTNNAKRDGHLKSPDFFSCAEFPEITFRSSKLTDDGKGTYTCSGELSLHGVTRPLELRLARIGTGKGMQGETRTGFEGVLTIKRSDFGMTWRPEVLGDEVRITVAVEGVQQ